MSDHANTQIPADLAPPYRVETHRRPSGERVVDIVSRDHVIATVAVGPRYARRVAALIVRACNRRSKP